MSCFPLGLMKCWESESGGSCVKMITGVFGLTFFKSFSIHDRTLLSGQIVMNTKCTPPILYETNILSRGYSKAAATLGTAGLIMRLNISVMDVLSMAGFSCL